MKAAGGDRFGARINEIHGATDVGAGLLPFHYQKRFVGADDSHVEYRQVERALCDICRDEDRKKPSQVIAELRAEVAALREELARRTP
jgi:hypothetical protein